MIELVLLFTAISLLGACSLIVGVPVIRRFRRLELSPVPIGFLAILFFGYVIHKVGLQDLATPFAIIWLLCSAIYILFQITRGRVTVHEVLEPFLKVLAASFVFLLTIAHQVQVLKSKAPIFGSFDLSSGDMNSYLQISENLRNRGWTGDVLSYDLGPQDDVYGKLNWIFEHVGSGGYVLLSTIASVLGVQTWQVGTISLGFVFIAIVLSGSWFLEKNAGFSKVLASAISLVIFSSSAYLLLVGWWALNQLIFTVVLLTLLSISRKVISERLSVSEYLLLGVGFSMAFEIYPSVAAYSLFPILLVLLSIILIRDRTEKSFERFKSVFMLIPLTYAFFGTAGFLSTVFLEQFDHKLDMGTIAPGVLDFLGVGGFFRAAGLSIEQINLATTAIWLFLIFAIVFNSLRTPLTLLLKDAANLGIVLGGSLLVSYSLFVSQTSYQAFKLRMMWIPVCLILIFAVANRKKSKGHWVFEGKLKPYIIAGLICLSVANSFGYSSFAAEPLKTNAEMLAITNDKLELKEALSFVPGSAITTDFSNGNGWVPSDRTIISGILEYPGKVIFSGSRLAGYPFFSGWVVTGASEKTTLGPPSGEAFSNKNYRVVHVCRLICTTPSSGITSFLAGVPTVQNGDTKFADTSFADIQNVDNLSLKIFGDSLAKVKVDIVERDTSCSSFTEIVQLDAQGMGRLSFFEREKCRGLPKTIFVGYGG